MRRRTGRSTSRGPRSPEGRQAADGPPAGHRGPTCPRTATERPPHRGDLFLDLNQGRPNLRLGLVLGFRHEAFGAGFGTLDAGGRQVASDGETDPDADGEAKDQQQPLHRCLLSQLHQEAEQAAAPRCVRAGARCPGGVMAPRVPLWSSSMSRGSERSLGFARGCRFDSCPALSNAQCRPCRPTVQEKRVRRSSLVLGLPQGPPGHVEGQPWRETPPDQQ